MMKRPHWLCLKKTGILIGAAGLAGTLAAGFHFAQGTRPTPTASVNAVRSIPCDIALATHSGESPIDKDILRYQHMAQSGHALDAYLERLGWAYVAKARASFDPGFYKLAQQTAVCLASKQPDNAGAQLLLGHVLHNLHQFKASEKIARALVAQRGSWADYGLLGDALMEQGMLDDAIDAYQQMLNRRPGPQAYLRAAHLRWLKGDLRGAIEMMHRVIASLGGKNKEAVAWIDVQLAGYLLQDRQLRAAQTYIGQALELQPNYPPALLLQGKIFLSDGDYRKATAVLSEAARLNPLPLYQWTYWEALQQAGEMRRAAAVQRDLLEKGALLDRRSFVLYLASTRQLPELALTLANEELTVRQDVFTFDALAWALRANGRLKEAYHSSRRALAEGTIDSGLLFRAAIIADETGNLTEARRLYQQLQPFQHLLLPSQRQALAIQFADLLPQHRESTFKLRDVDSTFHQPGETT